MEKLVLKHENPRALITGAMNIDIGGILPEVDQLGDTKDTAKKSFASVGGGGANCALALDLLGQSFKRNCLISFVTRKGELPPENSFEDHEEYVLALMAHEGANHLLRNVDIIDAARGMPNVIGVNRPTEYLGGRHITKQFVEAVHNLAPGTLQRVDSEAHVADLAFVDPRASLLGREAAVDCNKYRVPFLTDYGDKVWPEDPDTAYRIKEILERADVIIVPSDAVVEGMKPKTFAPDELLERIKNQYDPRVLLMSDGSKPVHLYVKGRGEFEIPVESYDGPRYALAVGDTRNAALMHFLLEGNDIVEATKKATVIASIKIRYPGRNWIKHLHGHLSDNPLFAGDYRRLQTEAATETPQPP